MPTKQGGLRGSLRNVSTGVAIIPDSAIHHWEYREGSGTTATDSIGDADGTINGASWISNSWVGGNALSGDGTDDYVNCGPLSTLFSSTNIGNHGVAFTIQTEDNNKRAIMQVVDSNFNNWMVASGIDEGGDDRVGLEIQEGSTGNFNSNAIQTDTPITDGAKHRVSISIDGTDANNWKLYLDGSPAGTVAANGLSDYSNVDVSSLASFDFPHFARNNDGVIEKYIAANLDDILIFDAPLTDEQHQDDYNRQPWS